MSTNIVISINKKTKLNKILKDKLKAPKLNPAEAMK